MVAGISWAPLQDVLGTTSVPGSALVLMLGAAAIPGVLVRL